MTPQQRDATIQHFSQFSASRWSMREPSRLGYSTEATADKEVNNTSVTVFLISLKAGGVALNLTEASMVFMMDSWWNPSVEYQAMDRIHRLGQKRPVKVVKLVVEDSIEDQASYFPSFFSARILFSAIRRMAWQICWSTRSTDKGLS